MIFQTIQSFGNSVAGGHRADQSVLLQCGPLVGSDQLNGFDPHFCDRGGKRVEIHLLSLHETVIAPEADRLLDLRRGGVGCPCRT